MELSRLDWNLVPVLDALLTERNVSRAARRLGISQPAASKALARLRRFYDDELLVRWGNAYELTALGELLVPAVQRAVGAARGIVDPGIEFHASDLRRTFTIATTDYAQAVLMPSLRDALTELAPGVRVDFVQPSTLGQTDAEIFPRVDGWISPRHQLGDRPHAGLMVDEWACVVDAGHPANATGLTLHDLEVYECVVPSATRNLLMVQWAALRAHGVEARIAMSTDSFMSIPFLVRDTDRIGILQRRLAVMLAEAAGVRVHPCPWPLAPLGFTFWFHPTWELDPAHRWFRELLASCMAGLDAPLVLS